MEGESEAITRFRRGIAVWNEAATDAADRIWHEDIVWEEGLFPDGGIHHGLDACVARMRERLRFLGKVQLELGEIETRDRRILVQLKIRGVGATSGVPAESWNYHVYDLADDGRVIHWREFLDRDEAEAAFRAG